MDTIAIGRIERAGQTFVIEPPVVLRVRPTMANGQPYWETVVQGEPPLDVDDGRSRPATGLGFGWFVSREFTINALAPTPEGLEPGVVRQLLFWWDRFVQADLATLSPWQRAVADRLRERMRPE